jgi:hypothetical protein
MPSDQGFLERWKAAIENYDKVRQAAKRMILEGGSTPLEREEALRRECEAEDAVNKIASDASQEFLFGLRMAIKFQPSQVRDLLRRALR